ncbi:ribonuclease E/G [Thalassospira sp. MA62]|nr:ribonuclease E/G [Thalassospira sp. MA62]
MIVGGTDDSRLLIDAVAQERRVALIKDDRLCRLWIDRGGPSRFDIHLGRISKLIPDMGAAMVALDGMEDGLLPFDRYPGALHEGQWVLVQISRLGFDDKGVKLTGRIAIEGVGMIVRPAGKLIELPRKLKDDGRREQLLGLLTSIKRPDDAITLRSAALDWNDDTIRGEYRQISTQLEKASNALVNPVKPVLISKAQSELDQLIERHLISGGECIVDGVDAFVALRKFLKLHGKADDHLARHTDQRLLFDVFDVEAEIADAISPRAGLPDGGWLAIDQATALCAIDVNAGPGGTGRDSEQRALDVNLRAVREIVHQVRLRNLGGLIVIDPIRMKQRGNRDKFDQEMRAALGPELDGAVQIGGFTRLGLYEFSRQRAGESLSAKLRQTSSDAVPTPSAALNQVVRGVIADARNGAVGAMRLYVCTSVAQRIASSPDLIATLARDLGAPPEILADDTLPPDSYRLEKK